MQAPGAEDDSRTVTGRQDVTEITEVLEGYLLAPGEWTPEQAAGYVTDAWQKAVESIVETGRRLIEAKERVGHGNWLPTIERLPFGEDTAQTLMRIARHPDLTNTEHARYLPTSWFTLGILTRLPEGEIPKRIEAGEITPKLDRVTAQQWSSIYQVAKQEALNAWNQAWDALNAAVSYVKTYQPPADTDIYASADDFIARVAELAAITRTWRNDIGTE